MSDVNDAVPREEYDKLRWMFDHLMRERHRRFQIRGGYFNIYAVVEQDLSDDYEDSRCPSCGEENDNEDTNDPCSSCLMGAAEHAMEGDR